MELEACIERYNADAMDVFCWAIDLKKEMQTLLIGQLFDRTVVPRDAPDPNSIVLRLDRAKELEQHFMGTSWGRNMVESEAEAWARFSKPPHSDPKAPQE